MRALTPQRYAASGAPTPAIDPQRFAHKCTSPARALALESDDEGPAPAPTPRAPAAVAADAAQAFIDMPGEDAKVVARVLDQTAARDQGGDEGSAAFVLPDGGRNCRGVRRHHCLPSCASRAWQSISLHGRLTRTRAKGVHDADVDDNFYLSYAGCTLGRAHGGAGGFRRARAGLQRPPGVCPAAARTGSDAEGKGATAAEVRRCLLQCHTAVGGGYDASLGLGRWASSVLVGRAWSSSAPRSSSLIVPPPAPPGLVQRRSPLGVRTGGSNVFSFG